MHTGKKIPNARYTLLDILHNIVLRCMRFSPYALQIRFKYLAENNGLFNHLPILHENNFVQTWFGHNPFQNL